MAPAAICQVKSGSADDKANGSTSSEDERAAPAVRFLRQVCSVSLLCSAGLRRGTTTEGDDMKQRGDEEAELERAKPLLAKTVAMAKF